MREEGEGDEMRGRRKSEGGGYDGGGEVKRVKGDGKMVSVGKGGEGE